MAWTTPSTWASGDWNLQIRDNMNYMFNNLPPVGSMLPWAGGSGGPGLSTGWLPCDGRSLSTTGTYAALFGVIGYVYGGSGGSFLIPQMAGRAPFGVGWDGTGNSVNHSVSSGEYGGANFGDHAHGLSGNANASTSSATSGSGGSHDHTFSSATLGHDHAFVASGNVTRTVGTNLNAAAPSHDHNFVTSTVNHGHGFNSHPGHEHTVSSNTSIAGTTSNVNSGYDTRPPFIGVYFIIRYV